MDPAVQSTARRPAPLRALGRAALRRMAALLKWWATTAQPVEPRLDVGFMDRASVVWGLRRNGTLPPAATTPPRARLRRHPERAVPEETQAILAAGLVAHVGFVAAGQPFVIPMAYHYDPATPELLFLHGGPSSRLLEHLASGAPAVVAVTLLDGLVFSRTALYHSVNYRSVVCFGRAAPPLDARAAAAALEAMIARYFPGRTAGRDYAAPPLEHLDATSVVVLKIEEWTAKARRGGPLGPQDDDPDAPGSAGVVDLAVSS
jgi:uncharacterized protein